MKLPQLLLEARFLQRPNRFLVIADLDGKAVKVFTPNPGRMAELLRPGKRLFVAPQLASPTRSTGYDLVLVRHNGHYIGVDSRAPSEIVAEALKECVLPGFRRWTSLEREVRFNSSRLDFRLRWGKEVCYLEVKSVNLVQSGHALFPDAPTERGARHLRELREAVHCGFRAAVLFVIQRSDATSFSPHEERDPDFARELRAASQAGVRIVACRCSVTRKEIRISASVPVIL